MRKAQLLLMLSIALLTAGAAEAGNCMWRTAPTNVVFGIYSAFETAALTSTSTYTFRCTPNTEAVLTFTTGVNTSTYFPRYLASGGTLLPYNLYDDAANTTVLGNGTGGTTSRITFNSSPQNKDFTETIYASAPQGADVGPGTYTDTVTAILSWDNGAGSSSVSFTVTAIVQAECTVTASPVDFGNYDPVGTHASAPLDGSGMISVYCTPGTVATVSLGDGLNFAGGLRRMAGPAGSFLNYQLFRNASRTEIWSTAPNTVSGTATSRTVPIGGGLTVYGRVPANQDPRAGVHNDVVQAVVNY